MEKDQDDRSSVFDIYSENQFFMGHYNRYMEEQKDSYKILKYKGIFNLDNFMQESKKFENF